MESLQGNTVSLCSVSYFLFPFPQGESTGQEVLRQTLQGVLHRRPEQIQGEQGPSFSQSAGWGERGREGENGEREGEKIKEMDW